MTCGEKQNISQVLKGFEGNLRVVWPLAGQDFREQQTFLYNYKLDITSIGHDLSSENMMDCDVIICVSAGWICTFCTFV